MPASSLSELTKDEINDEIFGLCYAAHRVNIFVTLLGCSLSFYNAIQYKFVIAFRRWRRRLIPTLCRMTSRIKATNYRINGVSRYRSCRLLHGDKQVYTLARNGSYRPVAPAICFVN